MDWLFRPELRRLCAGLWALAWVVVALLLLLPQVSGQTPDGAMARYTVKLESKSQIYREAIQAGLRDLVHAVRDPASRLAVDGTHGLASLRMAVAASA